MNTLSTSGANARALARIFSKTPRWVGVAPAREAIGLAEHMLLHAGPPLIEPTQPPAPMRHAAILACLHEGWAANEAAAAQLIQSGKVRLEPGASHRLSTPLVSLVSASTTLAIIDAGEDEPSARWYGFLGTGGGAQMRFGALDHAIVDRLQFREQTLRPGFAALLDAGPVDLLAIARAGLSEGDDLHNRLSSATQVLHAVLASRKIDLPAPNAALGTILEAPLYFLNLWIPACALMLDSAVGEAGASLVTRFGANGEQIALQIAGLPGRWFRGPATPVRGPFMKGIPENRPFPPVTGDSGIIDAFGLGGQVLHRAPSLRSAFAPWLAADDATRAKTILCGVHPVLGVMVGLDAHIVATSGRTPLLSTGMVSADGSGLLGRGLCEVSPAPFIEAMSALMP
jgi:Protein of unknown function (DUF1116)